MGFLDNSGDIILDAVLTDLGRKRLAAGNGTFSIAKFALGDDEIDYGLYDKNNPSGSAYYDISILQTPVLEAFTNNMSSMKSRLMSYNENDLLYLPVIKVYNESDSALRSDINSYIVLVDARTVDLLKAPGDTSLENGFLNGITPGTSRCLVRTDQGLDTDQLPSNTIIPPSVEESQYFIQIDDRLGYLYPPSGGDSSNTEASAFQPTATDDDGIATYAFTETGPPDTVVQIPLGDPSSIIGPKGTRVSFKIAATLSLTTSTFLFKQLGTLGTVAITNGPNDIAAGAYRFIDSVVRISGISTGYTLDIPVRFVKANL
jgi:hypothetical protein